MSSDLPQISVAFCCLGNICRSPMAEAIFKHTVSSAGVSDKFKEITSFGTAAYHIGEPPDHRSVETCENNGVPISHLAQQIVRTLTNAINRPTLFYQLSTSTV